MNTVELLDALKRAMKMPSDYALAKHWGIDLSLMSKYRNGRATLGDELALKAAEDLGLEPGQVLAWIAAERAERADRPEVARAWKRLAKAAEGAVVATIVVQMVSPAPAPAAAPSPAQCGGASDRVCIMLNRLRRWLAWLPGFAELPLFAL